MLMRLRCAGCDELTITLPLLTYTEQFKRTCRKCGTEQLVLAKPAPLTRQTGWLHTVTSHPTTTITIE